MATFVALAGNTIIRNYPELKKAVAICEAVFLTEETCFVRSLDGITKKRQENLDRFCIEMTAEQLLSVGNKFIAIAEELENYQKPDESVAVQGA